MKDAIADKRAMIQIFFKFHIENHVSTKKNGHCIESRDKTVKISGQPRMFSKYYFRLIRKKLGTGTERVENDERSLEIAVIN